MIPFWHFDSKRLLTRQENLRVFKIVAGFLLFVAITYAVVALTVFGHL